MKEYFVHIWRKVLHIRDTLSERHMGFGELQTWKAIDSITDGFFTLGHTWECMNEREKKAVRDLCNALGLLTDEEMAEMAEEAAAVADIREQERLDRVAREVESHEAGGQL